MNQQLTKIYEDFIGRREALLKAMTTDSDQLINGCNADTNLQLVLIGQRDGSWKLEQYGSDQLELKVGLIDPSASLFQKYCWLNTTAKQADAWLLSVAFGEASMMKLNREQRQHLFEMILDVPFIAQTMQETAFKGKAKNPRSCGSCQRYVYIEQYWVACTHCSRIFHAKCLKIDGEVDKGHHHCRKCGRLKIADLGSLGVWELDDLGEGSHDSDERSDSTSDHQNLVLLGESETNHCHNCKGDILDSTKAIACTICLKQFHAACTYVDVEDNDNVWEEFVCDKCTRNVSRLENVLTPLVGDDNKKKCGACDDKGDFWVSCVVCDEDFHGKCVEMPRWACEKIKQFKRNKCTKLRGYKKTPVIKRLDHLSK